MHYLRWQNLVDLVVLAVALYVLLRWSQAARAIRLALAILLLRVGALLSAQFRLVITPWFFDAATAAAIVVLLVLFQPELRHALTRLDWFRARRSGSPSHAVDAVATALFSLAAARRGALIVVVRHDPIDELIGDGVPLGGLVSPQILEAIFRKTSPVHDGAAIIAGDQVTRVGAILPLTHRAGIPREYGTRHRAAIGLAEQSDAIVLVASEERGTVTLMHRERIMPIDEADHLRAVLVELAGDTVPAGGRSDWLFGDVRLTLAALGLALLVWTLVFVVPAASVRVRAVPVVVAGVRPDLTVASQSAVVVQAELRAKPWLFDTVHLEQLVATVDLHGAGPGMHTAVLAVAAFNLPSGIQLQSVSPRRVSVDLIARRE
jgi:uncharacterized protein (TIGR00159 family)